MKRENLAVLLTCHNRRSNTVACLTSFYQSVIPSHYTVDIYLTDDGSTDGTSEAVKEHFPAIEVIQGDGNLYWAGGMRLAWKTAICRKSYDVFLLLNDDVILRPDFFLKLIETDEYVYKTTGKRGVYSGATYDNSSNEISYGASNIRNYLFVVKSRKLVPADKPQACNITNANILWVNRGVVDQIGIFDDRFTHAMADHDYALQASKKKLPVYLAHGICGVCVHDHGKSWRSSKYPLKERIAYLKSPKGLAYREYLYYVGKHFPLFVPYSYIMLWMKTFFPFIWDRIK